MGETQKSYDRRMREGWFEKYIHEPGIDLGCNVDPVHPNFRKWDQVFGDPDATYLAGVLDESYQTVYASHLLEHLDDPIAALKNWYRVLKKGGHLIVLVPHRDLYEQKKELPSNWAPEHKRYYLPTSNEPPCTANFQLTLWQALPEGDMVLFRVLDENWQNNLPGHPGGEYSIEAIIRKPS
jgi:SAM-dependent methyltransferase